MGTSTAVIGAAVLAVVILALVAGWVIRAANRAERSTEEAIRRIGDSIGGIVDALGPVAQPGPSPVGVTLDLDELLLRIAAAAASLHGVDAGAVRAMRRTGPVERAVGLLSGSSGLESAFDPPDRMSWRAVELAWRHPAGVPQEPVRSAMVVPIELENRRLGVVGAYARTAGGIGEAAGNDLLRLASDVAPALEAALTHADTKDLVVTDSLTGLLNRRGYDESLARECARAARSGRPLSLLLVDLDDFHDVNNRFGYPIGDAVLVAFCDAARAVARGVDLLCRRGGEEFALVLPDATCEGAQELDARLRATVAATLFPEVGTVTFSGGIACWQTAPGGLPPTPEDLDERASTGVRRAKELGKNQTVVIDG